MTAQELNNGSDITLDRQRRGEHERGRPQPSEHWNVEHLSKQLDVGEHVAEYC